jgi:hypothetical protein
MMHRYFAPTRLVMIRPVGASSVSLIYLSSYNVIDGVSWPVPRHAAVAFYHPKPRPFRLSSFFFMFLRGMVEAVSMDYLTTWPKVGKYIGARRKGRNKQKKSAESLDARTDLSCIPNPS